MGKALRINVHPRVVTLANILGRGERTFSELHPRDKELLLQSDVRLDDMIPPAEITKYELEKKLKETDSTAQKAMTRVKLALNDA